MKILKKIYGTRCDWEKLINLTSDSIEEKSVKYAASENRIDLTSKTMMNAIDSLDKEIPGLRKTYEVLCEFAHPNAGSVFAFMISVKCVSDKATGIDWVEKQFGLEPPRGFTAELSSLLEVIFSKVAAALSR